MLEHDDKNKDSPYLTGRLLLAMPTMGDPRFHKAVIFMCAHDQNGAMGLVLNHVLPGLEMRELFNQLDIQVQDQVSSPALEQAVLSGGPVETARGFILHSHEFEQSDTIKIDESYSVTGTLDALKAVAEGHGPRQMLFILGYAGWSPGQLDEEIQQNAWLVIDPDPDLLFSTEPEEMWGRAVKKLGIDPSMLSGAAGNA